MANPIQQAFLQLPLITRTYATACCLTTLACVRSYNNNNNKKKKEKEQKRKGIREMKGRKRSKREAKRL